MGIANLIQCVVRMVFIVQFVSLLITAAGAILAVAFDLQVDGQLTTTGVFAVVLVVSGLVANGAALALQYRERRRDADIAAAERSRAEARHAKEAADRAASARQQQTIMAGQLAEQSVRSVGVHVRWGRVEGVTDDVAVVACLRCRKGRYGVVLPQPTEGGAERPPRFRPTAVMLHESGTTPLAPQPRAMSTNLPTMSITISLSDLPSDQRLLDVARDLVELRLYVAVPILEAQPDDAQLRRGLATVASVTVIADRTPIQTVSTSSFSPSLILSPHEGGDYISSGRYSLARFYGGPPDWEALARAGDPSSVAAPKTMGQHLAALGLGDGDITVEEIREGDN